MTLPVELEKLGLRMRKGWECETTGEYAPGKRFFLCKRREDTDYDDVAWALYDSESTYLSRVRAMLLHYGAGEEVTALRLGWWDYLHCSRCTTEDGFHLTATDSDYSIRPVTPEGGKPLPTVRKGKGFESGSRQSAKLACEVTYFGMREREEKEGGCSSGGEKKAAPLFWEPYSLTEERANPAPGLEYRLKHTGSWEVYKHGVPSWSASSSNVEEAKKAIQKTWDQMAPDWPQGFPQKPPGSEPGTVEGEDLAAIVHGHSETINLLVERLDLLSGKVERLERSTPRPVPLPAINPGPPHIVPLTHGPQPVVPLYPTEPLPTLPGWSNPLEHGAICQSQEEAHG